jgi:hypothetical protein
MKSNYISDALDANRRLAIASEVQMDTVTTAMIVGIS